MNEKIREIMEELSKIMKGLETDIGNDKMEKENS